MTQLIQIKGIGKSTIQKLNSQNINDIEDLALISPLNLSKISYIGTLKIIQLYNAIGISLTQSEIKSLNESANQQKIQQKIQITSSYKPSNIQIDDKVIDILHKLPDAHIVGGFVRDSILNRPSKDIDICTSALPSETKKLYPNHIPLGEKFGTIIIKVEGIDDIEVTTMRSDMTSGRHPTVQFTKNIITDLARRDFTMNAMALNKNLQLIDPYNGQSDIKNKTIRAVGNPFERMSEDPLRALRGIRFASQLNFEINPALENAISQTSLKFISPERIKDEFLKSLHYNPVKTLKDCIRLNIMQQIIPDYHLLSNCPHDPLQHPDGNGLEHTFQALRYPQELTPIQTFTIAVHDYGKIYTLDPTNPNHYYGHEKEGAVRMLKILKSLKFSNDEQSEIIFGIKNHMKMHNIQQMRKSKRYKLYSSPYFETLLKVHKADTFGRDNSNYDFIINDIPEYQPLPLIDGNYLISIGFKPSKELGLIKSQLYDMQIEENLTLIELQKEAMKLKKIN